MTEKDNLMYLIEEAEELFPSQVETIADHLIANGVTLQDSKPMFLLKHAPEVDADMLKAMANSPVFYSGSEETIIPIMPDRWIPVTEKLPEDDLPKGSKVKQIKVLTALKSDKGVRTVRSQMRFRCTWYSDTAPWAWKYSGSEITHWMPMPKPPKEE